MSLKINIKNKLFYFECFFLWIGYYAARQAFYRLISGDDFTLHLKLAPGQMLIMDNYRLFHGRSAFQLEGGIRHMRQGYVDRDSTASRRLLLADQLAGQRDGQFANEEASA